MIKINNYINGEFQPAKYFLEDRNPATGKVIAKIPKSDLNDVEMAVNAEFIAPAFPIATVGTGIPAGI